jgi:hypothetical protein
MIAKQFKGQLFIKSATSELIQEVITPGMVFLFHLWYAEYLFVVLSD